MACGELEALLDYLVKRVFRPSACGSMFNRRALGVMAVSIEISSSWAHRSTAATAPGRNK